MQRARIEIGPVRPNKGSGLRIQDHAIEHAKILKRTVQRAVEDWPKVDVLTTPVTEADTELVRPSHFEAGDADDGVSHYLNGSILTGG